MMEKLKSDKIKEMIKNQCYQCSSNDTIIIDGELYCNNCRSYFII